MILLVSHISLFILYVVVLFLEEHVPLLGRTYNTKTLRLVTNPPVQAASEKIPYPSVGHTNPARKELTSPC